MEINNVTDKPDELLEDVHFEIVLNGTETEAVHQDKEVEFDLQGRRYTIDLEGDTYSRFCEGHQAIVERDGIKFDIVGKH